MASGGMSAAKGMPALFQNGAYPLASAMRLRAGAGQPVGIIEAPDALLLKNAELIWDNGSPFSEHCLNNVAPMVGKYEALTWTMGSLGLFAGIAGLVVWNNKASRILFAPGECPYNGLQVELGKEPSKVEGCRCCCGDKFSSRFAMATCWVICTQSWMREGGVQVQWSCIYGFNALFQALTATMAIQTVKSMATQGKLSCCL